MAAERAGTSEPRQVAHVLRRGRFDTVLGRIAFDPKGDLEGAGWTWHIWREGGYRVLGDLPTQ